MTNGPEDTTPLGRSVEEVEDTSVQPSQEQGGFLSGLINPSPGNEQNDSTETPSLGRGFTHILGMDNDEPRNQDGDNGTSESSEA